MFVGMKNGNVGAGLELSFVSKLASVVGTNNASEGSVRKPGEYFVAREPNSFGLPSVDSCPGSTIFCEARCYAIQSEKRSKTADKLKRNYDYLKFADTVEKMAEAIGLMIAEYSAQADKLGVDQDSRNFRIHWSGDFFSVEYALAWRTVIEENPGINFYAYTRTFGEDLNVVPALAGIENLSLFLSVDENNVYRAKVVLDEHPDVRAAYFVDYEEDAEELANILGRHEKYRNMTCPENVRKPDGERKLPVISKKGGACSRCTYCIGKPSHWDVTFLNTGKELRVQQIMRYAKIVPVELSRKKKTAAAKMIDLSTMPVDESEDIHPRLFN
jgi:hypothetical protein